MKYGCDVMVDIETMSTEPNAAIVSIGACAFDMLDKEEDVKHTFLERISLVSNTKHDRHVSADTVTWWMRQSQEARDATFTGLLIELPAALDRFNQWVASLPIKPNRVWARDPDFDIVILREACKATGRHFPFAYWSTRSVRTIVELAYPGRDEPKMGDEAKHSALNDAVYQALLVKLCYHKLLL